MKKLVLFFIVIYSFDTANSQNQGYHNIEIPNMTLKSPEVQGFERYGEVPVDEYTGTPSINIPLYLLEEGDIKLPISLNYHATGIQVNQESTWVGLGWNLLAGGCISRIPVGQIDGIENYNDNISNWIRLMNYSPNWTPGGYPRRYYEDNYCLWDCVPTATPNPYITNDVIFNSLNGNGERDVYSVNLSGQSFKFSIHPVTDTPIPLGEKTSFKIEKIDNSWRLTDDKGIKYLFDRIEYAKTPMTEYLYISTWYLSSIESQTGTISFQYQNIPNVELLPSVSEYMASGYRPKYYEMGMYSRTSKKNRIEEQLYLSAIGTDKLLIKFKTKNRIDIRGGDALDEITVTSKADGSLVKSYKFEHGYFNGAPIGTDISTDDYIVKRLKLKSLYESNNNKKVGKYDFTYNETTPLPYKTSFSQDYWGYYNGEENKSSDVVFWKYFSGSDKKNYPSNRGLLPSYFSLLIGDSVSYCGKMNEIYGIAKPINITKPNIQRNASKNYITTGTLKSIKYPTGGETVFQFEPHTFTNFLHPCVEDMNTLQYPSYLKKYQVLSNNNDASHKLNKVSITLEKDTRLTFKAIFRSTQYNFYDMYPSYVKIKGKINGIVQEKIVQMDNSQMCNGNSNCDMYKFESVKSVTKTGTFSLSKGTFTLEAAISSAIPNQGYRFDTAVEGIVEVSSDETNGIFAKAKKFQSYGGGIRIKEIINYDNDKIISKKTYHYEGNDGKSSGKLIYPLHFNETFSVTIKEQNETGSHSSFTEYNPLINSRTSLNLNENSPHAIGAVVGYSRVEIRAVDSSTNAINGKIIKEYINIPTKPFYPDFFYPSDLSRHYMSGKMNSEIILNNKNDTVSVNKYNYDIYNYRFDYINFNIKDNYIGPTNICGGSEWVPMINAYAYLTRFRIIAYPTTSYNIALKSENKILYSGVNKTSRITSYEYDTLNYKIKKKIEFIGNKNLITTLKYPHDFRNKSIYNTMLNINMISQVVEESTYIGATLIFNKKTDYGLFGNIIAPKEILIKNSKQDEESRIQFVDYTNYGKPKYITKDEISKVIYLWGYNYQYPIAEIKNATYTEIIAIVSEATLNSIAAKAQPDDSDWSLLQGLSNNINLKNTHITLYKYKPFVGIYEMINPTGISTFYIYDSFNRLIEVYESQGNVKKTINTYYYNYINK